uniref:uncharacterized protein LOC109952551 n=1 Tax=Monopterus albus TaxID=43700 RepID=UPI0009B30826|nr:uncharacterized protein LOC109952551 [Monopterus albus]
MARNFMGGCLCSLLSASVLIAGCTVVLVTTFPVVFITLGTVYMYECPLAPVIPVYMVVCGILALVMMAMLALPKFLCPAAEGKTNWTLWLLGLLGLIWLLFGSYQVYSIYPPNYNKNITDLNRVNNSIDTPTASDNRVGLTLKNQNQSLPNLNHTWIINNNQTLRTLLQTLAVSNISNQTNGERPNAPPAPRITAAAPYCDKTVYLFAFWTTTLVYVFAGQTLVLILCLYGSSNILNKISLTT